jgi:hypothetical protein
LPTKTLSMDGNPALGPEILGKYWGNSHGFQTTFATKKP